MYAPELAATASALSVDWVAAIGPTLLLIIGGLASWFIRSRTEDLRAAEERLHEERRRIYVQVLEPYIKLFASIKSGDLAPVTKQMASYEYRKVSFELLLVGSDEVVKAYNALMTFS